MGCIIDQGKRTCSQTCQVVNVIVDIALLAASGIAVLTVNLAVNTGDRIRISSNGASLKALVVVKKGVGCMCRGETLLTGEGT